MIVYRSAAGSSVTLSGKSHGIVEVEFDWFEENACPDAGFYFNQDDCCIVACCDCCGVQTVAVKIDMWDSLSS